MLSFECDTQKAKSDEQKYGIISDEESTVIEDPFR